MDVFGGAPRFLAYPRPVVVQGGTDAVLKCQIGGDPRPAVIWERNNEQIHPDGRYRLFEDGNVYNLIISSVDAEDSGQYICKAKNSIGETYAAATLKVEGEAQERELREENKPRFLIKPLSTRVGRGDDAVFSCKLWGKPRPEVTWEKDGKKLNDIFESTHFTVGYQDGGWFQLKIFKTRAPDGGVYTCRARNEYGEGLAGAVLLVDAGPAHEEEATRNGYANGHWKPQQGKPRGGRQIATRQKEDPVPHTAKVKMFAVSEGKHAKFRCYVTGKPKPEIIWRKDGRLIMSGRRYLLYEDREGYFTLKVLYCKQEDNGLYVCAASNTAGQTLSAVHLTVKEPPVRFKQPLCDLEVWERDLAVLECEVPEDSVPTTWYLEDRRLHPGDKYGMEQWGTMRRLTIRDMGADDDGIYLCEMADGGRSIAEVSVRGTIVRKLPRKVDVLEEENAAFCVEVEEEEMDIHWYRNGIELRETHQTIIKSFGKTHILVFVNTSPQDSGLVTFVVGRSKTTSQLRVRAARHSPPSCPVGVQMNTERANAALLSWVPAHDSRKNPPAGYVLERQELGSQEWLQCLTTDTATAVEILGDSVPCEEDYRFRICSVNKYGRSGHVDFPGAVHLVPVARIQTPLQDALVPEGQDAEFSIELSASVMGTWFLNGTQLQEGERFSMHRSRSHHSLCIRDVHNTDNRSEITFIAYGVRDSAALYIQAPLVKFVPLPEMDRNKAVEAGSPIVLYCELSDNSAQVHWYKDGVELHPDEGLHMQSEGTMRRLVIQSAEFSHSGIYSCDAIDDVIRFHVKVEASPVRFTSPPEVERNKSIEAGCPIVLHCELSDPTALVSWYKDDIKLLPLSGTDIQSEGTMRRLVIQSADLSHSGAYSCQSSDDTIHFNVDIKAPPVRFTPLPEVERNKSIEAGCPIVLHCELSDPTALVSWYKDDIKLLPLSGTDIQSEGTMRRLVIQSAELSHSGAYSCDAADDVIHFKVDVKAPPVRFTPLPEVERNKSIEAGCPIVLHCELSDPTALVSWYKDDIKLLPLSGTDIQSEGTVRRMVIQSAELSHSGAYSCQSSDDTIHFNVDIKAPPVRFTPLPEVERNKSIEAGCPIVLHCELSDPTALVSWYKDDIKLLPLSGTDIQSEGTMRRLVIQSAELSHSGAYSCDAVDDVIHFKVDVKAPPVRFTPLPEVERNKSIEAGCPIVLHCELSDPTALVSWYKDDIKLLPLSGTDIQSEGTMRRLVIQSAELSHSGAYSCDAADDVIHFKVDVKAPPVRFTPLPEVERNKSIEAGCPIVLHCELSDPTALVSWYKDDIKLLPLSGTDIQSEGTMRRLVIQSAELSHSGAYSCDAADDVIHFKVDVKAPPVRFTPLPEVERNKSIGAGCPIVQHCELSDPTALVSWYKDDIKLLPLSGTDIQSEGTVRRLVIQSAELSHSREYSCDAVDDVIHFKVDVKAPPVRFTPLPEVERNKSIEAGCPIVLHCELSDPTALVSWYKDDIKLLPLSGTDIQSEGTVRRMVIQSADLSHSGAYSCDAVDDVIHFKVDVKAPPVRFTPLPEVERNKSIEAGCPIVQHCELSDPTALVCCYKDDVKLLPLSGTDIQSEGTVRRLVIQSAELSHSGAYSCDAVDDINFKVDVKAPPVRFTPLPEVERNKSIEAGCPIVLHCELSDPTALVSWYKDDTKLLPLSGTDIQSEGTVRRLVIQSAELSHSGAYSCVAVDDVIHFKVDVKARQVMATPLPEVERNKSIEAGCPIVLHCELSDPTALVSWYKDGKKLLPLDGIDIQSEGSTRRLVIQSAQCSHSGAYSCDAVDEVIQFKVDVEAPPVRFTSLPEVERNKSIEAGCPIVLHCELSDPTAQVSWYKDGTKLLAHSGLDFQSEGNLRKLVIQSAEFSRSGVYSCKTADDISEFYVDVKVPPVKFVEVPDVDLHKSVVESEPVVLYCELTRPDVTVQWYKDGVEIQTDDNISVQAEQNMRRLIIQSTNLSDLGIYTCRAGESVLIFKVNVREPPVGIVHPKEDVHLDRHVSEEIVLSCELSRSNATVHWYKDGHQIEESGNIKFKAEGPYRRLVILHGTTKDSGEYVCDTADDSIFFQVNITEPAVHIVSPNQSPVELNQLTSERLVLGCEVSRANAIVRWYRDGLEVEESDNLILEVEEAHRRLIIPKTTVLDSAEYVCDAVDDSMTFHVKITEPPVKFVHPKKASGTVKGFVGEPVVLECEVSRSNAVVCWKKEGVEVEESRRISIIEDRVLRQLTIHSAKLEDSGQYICDANDETMDFKVKVTEPPVQILRKGELKTQQEFQVSDDVVLECELSRANAMVKWYKDGEKIIDNDRLCMEVEGAFRSLVILNAEISDSGEYFCDARDDNVVFHVSVKEPPVSILGNSDSPEHHSLVAGDDLVLTCEVSRPSASVQWYWNKKLLNADSRTRIESQGTVRQLVISGLCISDAGEYVCDAIDDKMVTMVKVQEPPITFLNKEDGKEPIQVVENESVTLCARVSKESAPVQWLKNWKNVSGERFSSSSDGKSRLFSIQQLQLSDSGVYTCDAYTDEMHFTLQVKEMKLNFARMLEDVYAHKDDTIILRCELCKPKGDVLWLKDGQEIIPSRRLVMRAEGRERSLTIHRSTGDDSGEYTCESKDDRTCAQITVEMPRVVEFVAELHNVTVLEGEDATFKCVVSPEDADLVWYRNGKPIIPNEKLIVSRNGLCHMLNILNCQLSDISKVTAEAEGVSSKANLKVQEAQVVFTKKLEAVVAEEHSEATLEAEVSLESGEVQWMRQGLVIQPGPKFTLKQNGRKRSLTVHNLTFSDRGTYRCETLHDRTQGKLNVESRKISIRKGLTDIETFERETASFEVELSHTDVKGVWQKDGIRLKPNNRWRVSANGQVHSLTLPNLTLEDTGTITFCAESVRMSARLTVKEPPVTFLKKLEDVQIAEGSGVSLECELSRQNVDIKWFKNGNELKPGKNYRIYSMGRKRFLQITKCVTMDSGVYTCDAGDASLTCALEVYERDVEVIQGLEDVDIEEDQNAVFMCEVSEDVPGEWFKNGERIKPTSTIKIRQEGTKHFLLMCNVKADDSGEIKFVAKQAESTANLDVEEPPVTIVKPLRDKTALEKHRVILECTVSNPRSSIRWYQGETLILPSERFEICSEGCYRKLVIHQVMLSDEGTYSVQVGEHQSSARLMVEEQAILIVRNLEDVEVTAPEEASFECEVSVPVIKSPIWSLNGEPVQHGREARLENLGTVHRLTLRKTSTEMSGIVKFTAGKARSSAKLNVRS
ncbi:obscurin-like protein 1a isoform X2 [Amia ocellicauda]|uniref:obscurin-like protein 1a isoform X2 n=1 Tax=Amia ocellicauda TaxID=2972642 RepID=UPI00346417BA